MEDKKGKRCLNNMNFVLMQILSMIMTVVAIRIRYSSALPSMIVMVPLISYSNFT